MILSDRIWRTRLGADPAIVGRTVNLSRRPFVIVGVMAAGLEHVGGTQRSLPHGETADFWIPLTFNTANLSRTSRGLNTVARLAPGVTVEQANAELDRLSQLQAQRLPDSHAGVAHHGDAADERDRRHGASGAAGDPRRRRVRAARSPAATSPASRSADRLPARANTRCAPRSAPAAGRLAREILVESWLLALLGACLGIPLAIAGVRALVDLAPPHLPRLHAIGVDAGMLAVRHRLTFVTSVLCGLLPAWYGSRTNLEEALRESGRSGAPGARSLGWHRTLVVAQLALVLRPRRQRRAAGRTFFLLQQQSVRFPDARAC